MLAIGCIGMQGERTVGQFGDAAAETRGLRFDTAFRFFLQALRAQPPDAGPQRSIRQQATFGPGGQPGFRLLGRIQ